MHQDNEVSVFAEGLRGPGEPPAGVGWLVTPSVVMMRQSGRGAMPGLPSHITVPAVSGGGRDTPEPVSVLGVHESPDLDGWVALALDRECDVPGAGTLPEGVDLGGLTMADLTRVESSSSLQGVASLAASDSEVNLGKSWVCKWFPSLPGCR